MDKATFDRVLATVLRDHPVEAWWRGMSPFEVLVSVVISQNTTVANERRAMQRLRERVGIAPTAFASAPVEALEDALRPAGLFRTKARRLREIARRLVAPGGLNLRALLEKPTAEARQALMGLPGVGPKTADVVLNVVADRPTLPVDTHIWRIARRWELTPGRTYEEVRGALETRVPPHRRREAHLALIRFGRTTCTARRPRCPECPVRADCPYYARERGDR